MVRFGVDRRGDRVLELRRTHRHRRLCCRGLRGGLGLRGLRCGDPCVLGRLALIGDLVGKGLARSDELAECAVRSTAKFRIDLHGGCGDRDRAGLAGFETVLRAFRLAGNDGQRDGIVGAGDKIEAMRSAGILVADSPASLGSTMVKAMGK